MKKVYLMMCFIVGFLMIPVTAVFAAGVIGEQVLGVEAIEMYFVSLAALSGAVLPVTEFIKKLLKTSGNWTRFLSWIVAIGLSFFGWWLNLGMLEGLSVLWVVIYGVAAGMISNSVFDIRIIQAIISVFKSKTDLK